ncbi:hypothetical protein BK816_00470 [Boudabousia tangfeifanii]|uniref:Asparagine synthetase domain-containing protein n=1 Tax=Boudabousia tangfeifanii TaxID=1912795 RepID=A0A1D9MI06_9ACTO|nr:hypothetical protein [Boudabousia tangfeifanii]AOZ71951.1 hypothetical protein BK816_00470 [Boudabousia tangfeifanii]
MEVASEVLDYKNYFSYGFFLSKQAAQFLPENWRTEFIHDYFLQYDPRLEVEVRKTTQGHKALILLGVAFDVKNNLKSSSEVADIAISLIPDNNDWTSFNEFIAWIGGRFSVFAWNDEDLVVHVDPCGTIPTYYSANTSDTGSKDLTFSSHTSLLATASGEVSSERKKWIVNHPDYINPGGKEMPGLVLQHDVAQMIFPNCFLKYSKGEYEHKRFFPSEPLKELTVSEATDIFIDEVRFAMEVWFKQRKKVYFPLTSGGDSNAILDISLDIAKKHDFIPVTYHFFERNSENTYKDLIKANQTCVDLRLPQLVIDISPLSGGTPMASLYNTTFPTWARFPSLANSFYHNLDPDSVLAISLGAEIGMVFYQDRTAKELTPEVLATKFTYSKANEDPKLIQCFRDYIEYMEFYPERIFNYDFYDLFYWEHRMGKWGASLYSEYDLATRAFQSLNSRRAFNAMLALPIEERVNKSIYKELKKRGIKSSN